MQTVLRFVRKPAAVVLLLGLLGVSAHAAAIGLVTIFTSRDEFEAQVGPPDQFFDLESLPEGFSTAINFGSMLVSGDMFVQEGAIHLFPNFSTGPSLAFNFASGVFAWGADVQTFGGPGLINISVGGLSRLHNFGEGAGFVGFATNFPFQAFNLDLVPANRVGGNVTFVIDNIIANTVPEPTTLVLLAAGVGLAAFSVRRRKRVTADDKARQAGSSAPPM
jgi:hypothetical protein